jgi:hypothetical protein
MGGLRTLGIFALIASPLGCSSFDDTFTDCNLGTVTGTWRIHYAETSGNCGPLADETVMYNGNVTPTSAECGAFSSTSSPDQCRMRGTSECPTADELGVQKWNWGLTQTAADQIEGSGTVQVSGTTDGDCESTYDVTITKM